MKKPIKSSFLRTHPNAVNVYEKNKAKLLMTMINGMQRKVDSEGIISQLSFSIQEVDKGAHTAHISPGEGSKRALEFTVLAGLGISGLGSAWKHSGPAAFWRESWEESIGLCFRRSRDGRVVVSGGGVQALLVDRGER